MRIAGIGIAVLLAVAFGFVGLTQAAPLDLKQVSADAKWVVHVDVDAVRASTVVQNAWKKGMEMHPECAKHMDKVKGMIGMDPRKDLHGVTMYGKQIGKHEGVLLVNADVDQKLLEGKAEKAPEHKVVKHGDYTIHTWADKHHGKARTVAGAFYKGGVAFSGSAEELAAALDVLGGKGAAGADSPLAGRVMPGTTVLMRVTGIAAANLPVKSPIVKQIDSARFAMGENDGQSFFRARAIMTNEAIVGQVKTIVEGGRAMALLHASKDEQAKKMVDAVKVTGEGKSLTIAWNAPASEVWDVMQKCAKKAMERHAKMGKKGPWQGKAKGHPAQKKAPAKSQEQEF